MTSGLLPRPRISGAFVCVPGMSGSFEGESPSSNLMEVKDSEAQGQHREVVSEGSVEQRREPTNRNRIRGIPGRTSEHVSAKSISIKGVGCKSGGCALKAAGLTPGGLSAVPGIEDWGDREIPRSRAEVSKGHIRSASSEGPNEPATCSGTRWPR